MPRRSDRTTGLPRPRRRERPPSRGRLVAGIRWDDRVIHLTVLSAIAALLAIVVMLAGASVYHDRWGHGREVILRVGDEEWEIDGYGLRDHSWGPRYWQAPWYYRWLTANHGPDFGFMDGALTDVGMDGFDSLFNGLSIIGTDFFIARADLAEFEFGYLFESGANACGFLGLHAGHLNQDAIIALAGDQGL